MANLSNNSVTSDLLCTAVQRAFVQAGGLLPALLTPLLRQIRGAVTTALIESVPLSELPDLLGVLLDDLLTDLAISDVQRISILTFVSDELHLQLGIEA